MKIIIDEREHDLYNKCSELLNSNSTKYKNISLLRQVLPLGDILIKTGEDFQNKDIILIERKSFPDLLSSIRDGRYNEQSYRLTYSSGLPLHNIIYLLEGMFSQTKEHDRKTIMSSITSLNYFKGFSVMRTANVRESAEWIICTADKIQREIDKNGLLFSLNKNSPKCNEGEWKIDGRSNNDIQFNGLKSLDKTVSFDSSIDEEQREPENEGFCRSEAKVKTNFPELAKENENETEDILRSATTGNEGFCRSEAEVNTQLLEIAKVNENMKDPPEYCSVVKKEKNKNITPENIGTILLCQIPLVHSVSAIAIMEKFSSIHHLMTSLIDDPNCLNDIYTETKGKKRKLSKTMIQNIIKYLLPMKK